MRLIDSSAWIEWVAEGPLHGDVGPLFPEQHEWLVPTIVQYELSKWLLRSRISSDRAQQLIAFSTQCVVMPLTTEVAIAASHYGRAHNLAVADAIIYASAQAHGADIVICEAHFDGLPNVRYLPKAPH